MKRVLPKTPIARFAYLLKTYKWRIFSVLIWLGVLTFSALSFATQPQAEATGQICILTEDVAKKTVLSSDKVSKKSVPLSAVPENAVSDCSQKELFEFPLLKDVQKNDWLQVSDLQPMTDATKLKQQQSSEQKVVVTIPIKRLQSIPMDIEVGKKVTLFAKAKKTEEAEVLLKNITVVEIGIVKDDDDNEQLAQIGIAVDEKQALSLTKALAEEAFLLVTSD